MLIGAALLAAAFVLWLGRTHLRERPYFERPDLARHRAFDPAIAAVAWAFLLGGMVALGRASARAATGVALLVALLWG